MKGINRGALVSALVLVASSIINAGCDFCDRSGCPNEDDRCTFSSCNSNYYFESDSSEIFYECYGSGERTGIGVDGETYDCHEVDCYAIAYEWCNP
jgi:hypothetical protein